MARKLTFLRAYHRQVLEDDGLLSGKSHELERAAALVPWDHAADEDEGRRDFADDDPPLGAVWPAKPGRLARAARVFLPNFAGLHVAKAEWPSALSTVT